MGGTLNWIKLVKLVHLIGSNIKSQNKNCSEQR